MTESPRSTTPIWILLDSQGVGGIESHALNVAKGLIDNGYPTCLVFLKRYGNQHPLEETIGKLGIPVMFLQGGFRNLFTALADKPRLVHTHGYKAGILGRMAARLRGIPVVSTFHAGEPGQGKVRLYDVVDRWTAFLAPAIAVSNNIAARVHTQAQVFKNFVDVPDLCPVPEMGTVGFVGRFSHEKGVDRFCQFAENLPEADFIAFGDGPMFAELQQDHSQRMTFVGAVPNMTDHWSRMGVLCMPSRHEGLPMAALEAMARGIPVIASAVGDLPKLIDSGQNGWVIPADDDAAFIQTLSLWLNFSPTERQAMAEAAWTTIAQTYSPTVVVPSLIAFYRQHYPKPFQ